MKTYVIIEDEDGKRVIPSLWLSANKNEMKWPPYKDSDKISKAVIRVTKPEENWATYPVLKIFKYYGK